MDARFYFASFWQNAPRSPMPPEDPYDYRRLACTALGAASATPVPDGCPIYRDSVLIEALVREKGCSAGSALM